MEDLQDDPEEAGGGGGLAGVPRAGGAVGQQGVQGEEAGEGSVRQEQAGRGAGGQGGQQGPDQGEWSRSRSRLRQRVAPSLAVTVRLLPPAARPWRASCRRARWPAAGAESRCCSIAGCGVGTAGGGGGECTSTINSVTAAAGRARLGPTAPAFSSALRARQMRARARKMRA